MNCAKTRTVPTAHNQHHHTPIPRLRVGERSFSSACALPCVDVVDGVVGGEEGGEREGRVAMDVVGGVIVAAQSGKGAGGGGGEMRGLIGVKRAAGSCSGDYGWDSPWMRPRRVSPRREDVGREDYELRSVLKSTVDDTRSSSSSSSSARPASFTSLGFGDHGAFSDGTQALLAPFYRPTNPVLTKPMPAHSWVDPLRLLLKKELTVTDVGELGRIILPKRDAECQLPHLDSKEGKLLSMEDYNSNKHWTLRFKWWPNNKSRMYVLESTGEFVKYYDLKEKDELIVYQDGVGNLVIRGQKWSPANPLCLFGPHGFKGKSTGKRSPKGANTRANARLSPTSNSHANSTQAPVPASLDSSPQASHPLDCGMGSVLSTSVLSTAELAPTSDGGGINWEKLPDPPALEFSDPPTIEFPGEFECTWGDFV